MLSALQRRPQGGERRKAQGLGRKEFAAPMRTCGIRRASTCAKRCAEKILCRKIHRQVKTISQNLLRIDARCSCGMQHAGACAKRCAPGKFLQKEKCTAAENLPRKICCTSMRAAHESGTRCCSVQPRCTCSRCRGRGSTAYAQRPHRCCAEQAHTQAVNRRRRLL